MHLHQEFLPPEELQNTIKCFWYDRRDFGETKSTYEILPDGYAEIVFHFGSTCEISYDGYWQLLPSPVMMGLLNQPVAIRTKNVLEIIGIRCYPWTVRMFDHSINQLQSKLDTCVRSGSIADGVAIVREYSLKVYSRMNEDDVLSRAGAVLTKAKGKMTVGQVADAAHATIRTLERKFKRSSGHTVKDVANLMRFEKVRNHLWLDPDSNLAALAHDLGYTDQSHLNREFKRYSGMTPSTFAREAKKGTRPMANFVAFVQA